MCKMANLITNFFAPHMCLRCDVYLDSPGICSECWLCMEWVFGPTCSRCYRGLPYNFGPDAVCLKCETKSSYLDGIRSPLKYNKESQQLVLRFKNGGDFNVLKWVLPSIIRHIPKMHFDYTVPVPLHFLRKIWRGYNQSAKLAKEIAQSINSTYLPILRRTKWTKSQGVFDKEGRINNVKGIFAVLSNIVVTKKSILLVDDVCTTGSTLEECAKVLKAAGAFQVYAIVIAKT